MDIPVALNVSVPDVPLYDNHELLCWVNACLQTAFTHINQLTTGAAFCQLMHILFPSKIDLSKVRFDRAELEDCRHNYNLLQTAFDEVGVLRYIPVNDLINKKDAVCLQFLRWFKAFFNKNKNNRHYNALEARGGRSIGTCVQLPKTTAVVCNITVTDKIIKNASPNPVKPLEEAEKLSVDILKTNVLFNEDKEQEDKTKKTPNLDQDTLKPLKTAENQESHLITPAEEAEKCVKETHLKTNFVGVNNYSLVSLLPQPHSNNLNYYYLNVPQVQGAEKLGKDYLKDNSIKLTPANVKELVEDKPKITSHIHQPCLNPQVAQTTNPECRANKGADIPYISSNNFSQPLYCLYVTPVKQPQLVGMSAMSTNDVILISDTEDKPVEGTTTSTPKENKHDNQKRHVPSGPTSTQKSPTLNSKVCPSDLKEVCSQTPYCLYVDMGLELDKNSCVVLIGYFDRVSGASVVKKLDTLCINQSPTEQTVQSVITKHTANAAADLLISLLKKSELPLDNFKVFYCNIPEPEVNWMVVRKLMELNPHLVSLGGLACMAGGACQIALFECYSHVVDLINDIHHFKLPNLTGTDYDIMLPISLQYSALIAIIQNMSDRWVELQKYFKTLHENVGASRLLRIHNQLQEHTVRLDFLFLSNALDPFRSFQDLQKNKTRDMVVELQMTSMLVHAYAASIFQPSAADQFVRKKDLKKLLVSDKELLPMSSVNVGFQARKYLSSLSFDVLGEVQRNTFLTKAVRFYQTTLKILVESLPGQLSPLAMRNIGTLLKHPHNLMSQEVSSVQLTELGCQLGVCKTDSSTSQLASEYVNYIQMANNGHRKEVAAEEGLRWVKVLDSLASFPVLYKLILTLLAFPRSLQLKQIFKPQRRGLPPKALMHKRGRTIRYHQHRPERERGEGSSSEEDRSQHQPSRPPVTPGPTVKQAQDTENSEYTDNSSDVIDVTEACKLTFQGAKKCKVSNGIAPKAEKPESVYILDSEDDQCKSRPTTVKPTNTAPAQKQQGELVLIYLEDAVSWPGVTVPSLEDNQEPDMKKVEWYGHNMTSEVCIEYLRSFADFAKSFSQNTFATVATYKEAVFLSLREASSRCQKQFSASFSDKDEILSEMLDWAFGGFKPMGPKGFQPAVLEEKKNTIDQASNSTNTKVSTKDLPRLSVSLYKLPLAVSDKAGGADSAEKDGKRKSKSGWKGKGPRKKSTLFEGFTVDTDMSPDFVPFKKRPYTKVDQSNKTNAQNVYTQPDQKLRERIIRRIMELKLDIEDFCLCCGTEDIVIFHPLFKGSLCLECKNNFTETLYRYDEDGYQSYCTICCYGMEVLLCGNDSCCRSFCTDCLNILVGEGTFDSLKDLDPWICYLCQPHQTHGALTPRQDWSVRVQELFANNSAMEFEPHRVYPSIPANLRRPIRVLSLFDGIATGYLVLKELGFKVEKYVASEVCEDSIAVSTVNHDRKIIHVGDARFITQEHLSQWGPFDLLIGGSPCNDLSIVNPLRKGLYEGTGRLFFEFYRVLQLLKPKDEDPRPFFWLFENVVFMNVHDRLNICRFLECNPVLVDAVKVSPANRARYFWGNIPGMSRPIAASQTDKLNLQDCLEIGRVARVTKVRTITTNLNSLKQGKDVSLLPVLQNGTEDTLWITEIEKIFGFPKHYTDVRNMNRQQRQKVLGKAWSVPVIRHLFAPLKDYFACEELPPMTASNTSTSSSSPCPLSPASPEMLQLR